MISWHKPSWIDAKSASYRWIVLFNVLITTFLSVLSAVSTIIADSAIQGELALSNRKAVWITTLYLLGINTVVPAANWFADRFGYKKMYAIGVMLFTLASALAAISVNFGMIASARLLEGVGGGFVFPVGLAIITQNFPKERLPFALILYVAIAFGGGLSLGLVYSGYLTQFYTWRLIFATIFAVGIIATIFCWLIHEETDRTEFRKFDALGYLLFATAIASLLVALTYGPLPSTPMGWRSPFIISCFAVSFTCLLTALYVELHSDDPIIPLALFKDPLFSVSSLAMFVLGMSIFASVSTMVDYMLNALMYEKYESAKLGFTYGFGVALCSVLSNLLIKKIPAQGLTFSGLFLLIISYFLNNELSWLTGPRQIFWILLLRGMGVGLALGPTTILAMARIPLELRNKGAALLTFFRQVGGTYGGTLIAILVIKRKIFHAQRFSEQSSANLPGYKFTYQKLLSYFYSDLSDQGLLDSAAQAKGAIIRNLEIQAYITAQNDALFVFGCVTASIALLLLFLNLSQGRKKGDATSKKLS